MRLSFPCDACTVCRSSQPSGVYMSLVDRILKSCATVSGSIELTRGDEAGRRISAKQELTLASP